MKMIQKHETLKQDNITEEGGRGETDITNQQAKVTG